MLQENGGYWLTKASNPPPSPQLLHNFSPKDIIATQKAPGEDDVNEQVNRPSYTRAQQDASIVLPCLQPKNDHAENGEEIAHNVC